MLRPLGRIPGDSSSLTHTATDNLPLRQMGCLLNPLPTLPALWTGARLLPPVDAGLTQEVVAPATAGRSAAGGMGERREQGRRRHRPGYRRTGSDTDRLAVMGQVQRVTGE